jgi:hypothetical protein
MAANPAQTMQQRGVVAAITEVEEGKSILNLLDSLRRRGITLKRSYLLLPLTLLPPAIFNILGLLTLMP